MTESKHGTVFLDPQRGFIQVRHSYFVLKQWLKNCPDRALITGHFAQSLNDAKNNTPLGGITSRMLIQTCINVEEVGLRNIPGVCQDDEGKWWYRNPLHLAGRFQIVSPPPRNEEEETKFYMVWIEGTGSPTVRHPSLKIATTEAARLLKLPANWERRAFILQPIVCAIVQAPKVMWSGC